MMKKKKKYTCHIVFQTHWDREWYLPFEVLRHRLAQVMDRVVYGLETGELRQFVLDGQMAALEDYFEVCEEEMKEKVMQLISEKKIIIGPWYVLADEFLVSGESLVRNLEVGIKLANQYGDSQSVGYLPDTFGHVSQMPQLLQGFGIDNAILWRGIKPETSEFTWQAPNGAEVFTVFLPEGYYQPLLNEDNVIESVEKYIEKVKPFATTSQLLLTNGGDHIMPKHGNVVEQIENLQVEEIRFVSSSYEDFLQSVRLEAGENLPIHFGEMRNNEHIYVLPNVLSTRTYLKEQNQGMEDELTGYTEPLATLCMEDKYPSRYIETAWKLLMQNHPHDSICGCSIDEVHREMETRTMMLNQRLQSLQTGALSQAGVQDSSESGMGMRKPFEDNSRFTVFNPHPRNFNGWIKGTIWLQEDQTFQLADHKGNTYTPTVLSNRHGRHFASPLDAFPDFKDGTFYDLQFYVEDLPATSLSTFKVEQGIYKELETLEEGTIENNFYTLDLVPDGTLTVKDKRTGKTFEGLQQFYSSLDAGDEYNYSPPLNDVLTNARLLGSPTIKTSNGVNVLLYSLELTSPSKLNEERTGPMKEMVISYIHVKLTLSENDRKIDVQYTIENYAKDQRLRVKFPLGTKVDETFSDTAFDVIKRKAQKEEQFDAEKQKEVPVVVEPSLSFVIAEKEEKGLIFYHRGLQEYQITSQQDEDVLEVTVVRSVGWLSRDDFRTRGGGAGPNMETPEGQCVGKHTFHVAFELASNSSKGEIATSAHLFRVPPRIYPGETKGNELNTLVKIDNKELQWSSLRRVPEGILLRLWNPTEQAQPVEFTTSSRTIVKVNLMHEKTQEITKRTDILSAKEIATYLFGK